MGEKGTNDSESGLFGEGERVSARDADATAVTTIVEAWTSKLDAAAVAASVTRDGNAALGALVTASSNTCTDTTLVTGAVTGMQSERESAVAAAAASRALSSCTGYSQAFSSGSNCSNTCSGGVSSLSSTITNSAIDVTSGSAVVRLRRVGVLSPRACGSEICTGRRGDSDDSREYGRANWCKSTCEAKLVGFGAVVGGSVLSAGAVVKVAAVVVVAARMTGCGTISALVGACFATDTEGGLASSVRRLLKRDLRGLGDFCAAATVVENEAEATLVCDEVGAGRKGVVGRGSPTASEPHQHFQVAEPET